MRRKILSAGMVSLALAACGPSENDPGPGAVTVGEARALDEAAEMLDAQRTPAEVLQDDPITATSGENSQTDSD
jgi:hypothetical protein